MPVARSLQFRQRPQAMLNGTETRSPTLMNSTSRPASMTSPVISWPRTRPFGGGGAAADHVLVAAADIGGDDLEDHAVFTFAFAERQFREVNAVDLYHPGAHIGHSAVACHVCNLLGFLACVYVARGLVSVRDAQSLLDARCVAPAGLRMSTGIVLFPLRLRIYADCPASSSDPVMQPCSVRPLVPSQSPLLRHKRRVPHIRGCGAPGLCDGTRADPCGSGVLTQT